MWDSLPGPCLQVIADSIIEQDVTALRLVCGHWAEALPLPRICIGLPVPSAGRTASASKQCAQLQEQLQHPNNAVSGSRHLVIALVPSSSQQQQWGPEHARLARPTDLPDLAAIIAALTRLDSLTIKVLNHKQPSLQLQQQQQDCSAALLNVLALPLLQQRLCSLSLSCSGMWPAPEQLAGALQTLRALTSLKLYNCPIANVSKLPSLPRLQHLSILGRPHEPIPPSYSIKQRSMLPWLPGLTSLVLKAMPLDLRVQELEDIAAWQAHMSHVRMQLPCEGKAAEAAPATAAATCGALSTRQPQQQLPAVRGRGGTRLQQQLAAPISNSSSQRQTIKQWVGSSIAQQCPQLVQLHCDMQLGLAAYQWSSRPGHEVHCRMPAAGPATFPASAQVREFKQQCHSCSISSCTGSGRAIPAA